MLHGGHYESKAPFDEAGWLNSPGILSSDHPTQAASSINEAVVSQFSVVWGLQGDILHDSPSSNALAAPGYLGRMTDFLLFISWI